jgi:hypothetical protein
MNRFHGDRPQEKSDDATLQIIFACELTGLFSKLVHRGHFRFEKAVNNLRSQNEAGIGLTGRFAFFTNF